MNEQNRFILVNGMGCVFAHSNLITCWVSHDKLRSSCMCA